MGHLVCSVESTGNLFGKIDNLDPYVMPQTTLQIYKIKKKINIFFIVLEEGFKSMTRGPEKSLNV